jgi:hypothetical protein
MSRCLARVSAARLVSQVIQRRPPFLGAPGGGAGAAGRVEDQIARVAGHHDAVLNDCGCGLYCITFSTARRVQIFRDERL